MNGLLEMDPYKRFTAQDAIMHEYFDDIREDHVEDLMNKFIRATSPVSNNLS